MNKLLLIVFVCIALAGVAESKKPRYMLKKPQCTEKRQQDLELDMAKLSPIGSKSTKKFPETYAEVQVFCR